MELTQGQEKRFDVLLVEYPGYGSRRGEPSERANVDAMIEAIDHAAGSGQPLVLLGESLGSAVVSLAAVARRAEVAALVLVTPLPDVASVAARHSPLLPTSLIVDRYRADQAIGDYAGPVAFVVAEPDEIIPAELGLAMHHAYSHAKWLEVASGATHNGLDFHPDAPMWRRVFAFVDRALAR